MKKALGLITAGLLAFSTVGALAFTFGKAEAPIEAKAISGRVVINGTDLMSGWTAESHNPVTYNGSSAGGSGSATLSYENDSYILYLNQFQINSNGWKPTSATSGYQSIIDINGLDKDLYIKMNGNNILTHKGANTNFDQCGMNVDLSSVNTFFQLKEDSEAGFGNLIINTREGATTNGTDGLVCKGAVSFSDCSITTNCMGPRIRSMYFAKKVTVYDGANLTANCENVTGKDKTSYGIYHASSSDDNAFTVEGGVVYAKGATNTVISSSNTYNKHYGIYCGKFVQNGGTVSFYGGRPTTTFDCTSVGLCIHDGKTVSINGGSFTAEGYNPSAYSGSFGIDAVGWGGTVQVQNLAKFRAVGWTVAVDVDFISLKTAEGWEQSTATGPGTLFAGNSTKVSVDYRRIEVFPMDYTVNHDSVPYDGEEHEGASVTINEPDPSSFTVKYKKSGESAYSTTAPKFTDVGTYYIDIMVEGSGFTTQKSRVEFQITIGTNSYVTEPSAKELTYSAALQDLVNAGTPKGGKLLYKLGDGVYGESVPQAQDAGTYTVYYKVDGSPNYDDIAERSVNVTIAKAAAVYSVTPTAKDDLVENDEAQELIVAGDTDCGTIVYRLGVEGEFAEAIPTATAAGNYIVQFKIIGSANYLDSDVSSVVVSIAAKPTPPGPTPPTPPGPTPTPSGGGSVKAGLPAGAVVGIVIGSIVLALAAAYFLLLFLFNKWIRVGDKALRVFPFAVGRKEGKDLVFGFPFKFEYRPASEIYKTKDEALK